MNYRTLQEGDIIPESYEFLNYNGIWTKNKKDTHSGKKWHTCDFMDMRVPIEQEYRRLESLEIIEEGDEYFDQTADKWYPCTSSIGAKHNPSSCPKRRLIKPSAPSLHESLQQGKHLPVPKDLSQWRKQRPVYEGFLKYFPDAAMECAHLSLEGNAKHGEAGDPLQWYMDKSSDELDCLLRHLCDLGGGNEFDDDGIWQETKAFWRAGANLQRKINALKAKGLYPPKFDEEVS